MTRGGYLVLQQTVSLSIFGIAADRQLINIPWWLLLCKLELVMFARPA
jgi:hypothetical protein